MYAASHMTDKLAGHRLREITEPGSPVRAFYLEPPDGSSHTAALLTFSPEGITITGDLRPGDGAISDGQTLDWFLAEHSEDVLCDAFLDQDWHRSLAVSQLKEMARARDSNTLRLLAQNVEDGSHERPDLISDLVKAHLLDREAAVKVGFGYDPVEAGWLVAIQRRFREVWPGSPNNA